MVAAALLLAGCSGGDDGDDEGGKKSGGKDRHATKSPAPEQARAPQEKLPSAYDAAKGWAVKNSEGLSSPVYAPHAKAVLFLKKAPGGASTQIVARDLKTGAERWTGNPVALPKSGQDSTVDGSTTLMVTSKGETDYAVVTFSGETGGDGANKSKETTQLTVFPANGSGNVEAARTIELPYSTERFAAQGTEGIVFSTASLNDEGKPQPTSVDVTTGKRTTYTKAQLAAPAKAKGCREERAIGRADCDEKAQLFGVSPQGPLATDVDKAFWLNDAWYSGTNAPSDAVTNPAGGSNVIVIHHDGSVVARWTASGDGTPKRWEIRDSESGKVRASVRCEEDISPLDESGPVISGGRYVSADTVVMDLKEDKGYCFEGNDDRKEVIVTTVDATHGTAYGTVRGEGSSSDDLPVEVDLAADQVTPLDPGTQLPSWTAEGVAAYTAEGDDVSWTPGVTAAFYPSK
ncbi:hypothetical protein LHJ74_28130 [Streptomyces sp. N2-109]|uniref:Lipoprotein n=1 Tax=Streptomyces gossypii TaxID=2883101 RepID=A0ABT2JYL7_9ACTN|nr:hypothetical protein [Streptomyces gossypii]MCT2592995.1 hypothetical protein [Streptomyces gossypii]MCT2593728.1 hypothetical protein [Streptomyces gossypii]